MPLPFVYPLAGAPGSIDADTGVQPETRLQLPWALNPETSWLDYRCWLENMLDPGMVLHKPLPQKASTPDDLGSVAMDDGGIDKARGGVSLTGTGVLDVIQRMATSTYAFALKGWGLRVGFEIPIPRLVSVGGVDAVPGIQRAYNMIVGNFAGVPVFYAQWNLEYMISSSPGVSSPGLGGASLVGAPVPFNPALHIRPDAELPEGIDFPDSQTDQNSTPAAPPPRAFNPNRSTPG